MKSYRRFSNIREPILIKELFKINFKNIPYPIGFAKLENGGEEICLYLQKFINFEHDLGYFFWENLNYRLKENTQFPDFIHDENLNKDLLKLVDLVINFHHKSFNLKHPLFEKEKYSKIDLQLFKDSQLNIMNEILREKDENWIIFRDLTKKFKKIQEKFIILENFLDFFKITVHQDLHLAQILVSIDEHLNKNYYLTDLEGDPNRPSNEKGNKDLIR